MKKWILITAAAMFAAGLVLGGAYIAMAQGNIPPTPFSGPGVWMGGRGMMGHSQAFSGTLPFGRGPMMHGWGYNEPFTGTAPFGPGMMRGWGYGQPFSSTVPFGPGAMMAPGGLHDQVWTAVAKELGLSYDQLQAELRTKTLEQLAQGKNVTLDQLQEVAQAAWKAGIDKLVEEGKLTREQADWMIQHMDSGGFPNFGLGQGPCYGNDDLGPQSQGNTPQGFGFRGGRGRGPGMMRQWTW